MPDDQLTRPRPPRHRSFRLPELRVGSPQEIYDGDTVLGERLAGADFTGRDLSQTSFTDCELVGGRFDDANLTGVHVVTSALTDLDVASWRWPRGELRQVRIERSRLGGWETYESAWRSVEITDCKIGYLNARASRWEDVTFRGCTLTELDLGGARVNRMRFENCRLAELHVADATLLDVDLREADLHAIDGLEGLRGCTITAEQRDLLAPLLAAHLGIDVQ